MRLKAPSYLLPILLLAACAEAEPVRENAAALDEIAAETPDVAELTGTDEPDNGVGPPGDPAGPQQPGSGSDATDPSGDLTLSASPATTAAGATMTLTLRNASREPIGYNLCTSALQTSAGQPVKTDRVCTMELQTLDAGASTDYSYDLPGELGAGNYRFSTQVERMESGRRSTIRSNSFEIR